MAKPKKIAVIDAETDPFSYGNVPQPFVWGYYDGDEFLYWWGEDVCTENMIEEISGLDAVVYAHNGGKFDFFYLLEYLNREDILLINGRITQARINECVLRDSYSIIPVPLSAYRKDDMQYWKMLKEHRNTHRSEIVSYLQTDCIALYELVTAFVNRYGRKLTLASASMAELKKDLEEKSPRPMERFNYWNDQRFRPYYYGGRCQARKTGELSGPWKIYDINSAYPFAMLHNHPDPTYNSFYQLDYLPQKEVYFAHIKAVSKGALPFRGDDGKLEFPDDDIEREYHVTGWEIRAGLETGTLAINDVLEVRVPDKVRDFSSFINRFYKEKKDGKKEGDKVKELFGKLFMNSSYGKFAINVCEHKENIIVDYGEAPEYVEKELDENGEPIRPWELNGTFPEYGIDIYERHKYTDEQIDAGEVRGFYNVAVAASITGFVRAYLWRAICQAKDVIYCDTDSLVCREFGGVLGDELGQWDYEGTADIAYIAGRKMYALRMVEGSGDKWEWDTQLEQFERKGKQTEGERWKIASKGARLRPEEIKEICEGNNVIDWFNNVPTFSLRFGTRFLKRQIRMTGAR